ncbi:MAG TPA: hypothetical protein VJ843_00680 [Candidatus Saccharimonadales bacterium]|nr:hypothetical protein [Candidatus Saccharimonadales bacterium]
MEEKIKVVISTEAQLFGSSQFTLLVNVINVHNHEVVDLDVEPSILPGKLIYASAGPREVELGELEAERRTLIKEMERQVARAYEKKRLKDMTFAEQFLYGFSNVFGVYMSLFVERSQSLIPTWATEATKINDWNDVERLEADIISSEKEDSFLRRAYVINKAKLQRCLERLQIKKNENLEAGLGISLSPGDSITFPFTLRAPHLFRPRTYDAQFKVTFKDREQKRLSTHSHNQKLYFYASAFAVPTGGMLGAIAG